MGRSSYDPATVTPALVEPEASESTARAARAPQASEDFEENEDENENKKSRPALLICMWRAWKYVSLS